jgi:hypothetical protein
MEKLFKISIGVGMISVLVTGVIILGTVAASAIDRTRREMKAPLKEDVEKITSKCLNRIFPEKNQTPDPQFSQAPKSVILIP